MPVIHTKANDLLKYKVYVAGAITVQEIVKLIDTPERTVHNWLSDTSTIPPEKLAELAEKTGDRDYIDVFVRGTKWELTQRQKSDHLSSPLIEILDVPEKVGLLIASLKEALNDKRISAIEAQKILSLINDTRKELDEVEQSVTSKVAV